MPQISVIVPVYNVENYIHRCINSILSQSYTDFELILIDDGSPDNCGAICDDFAAKDSRIHVFHQSNRGQSAARNVGIDWCISNSNSKWITFIDSDDWVHSSYLEVLVNAITNLNVNISCCLHCEVTCPETDITPCNIPAPTLVLAEEAYNAAACFKLYAKEYFTNVRFPEGRIFEDAATNFKVFFRQSHVALVDAPLYYYTINPQGTTHSVWCPKRMEEFQAFEDQLAFIKNLNKPDFFAKTVRLYLYAMIGQLDDILKNQQNIPQYNRYLRMIGKRMRKVIREYKSQANMSFKSHPQFYEQAYPIRMKLYWYWVAIKNKLWK